MTEWIITLVLGLIVVGLFAGFIMPSLLGLIVVKVLQTSNLKTNTSLEG